MENIFGQIVVTGTILTWAACFVFLLGKSIIAAVALIANMENIFGQIVVTGIILTWAACFVFIAWRLITFIIEG